MAKSAKRKADTEPSAQGSAEKKPSRSNKAQPSALFEADIPESEEDVAHLETQQFLSQTKKAMRQKTAKQKDGYAAKFKAEVEEKKQTMLELLDKRADDLITQRTKGHEALTSLLSASLRYTVPSNPNAVLKSSPVPLSSAMLHPLHQKATALSTLCHDLLNSYNAISQDIAAYESPLQLGQEWEGDCQRLHHLLDVGKRSTENRVRELLVERDAALDAESRDETEEKEEKAWTDLAGIERAGGGESWKVAAKKAVNGVGRLVRNLPEEEG